MGTVIGEEHLFSSDIAHSMILPIRVCLDHVMEMRHAEVVVFFSDSFRSVFYGKSTFYVNAGFLLEMKQKSACMIDAVCTALLTAYAAKTENSIFAYSEPMSIALENLKKLFA
jgi:hypothetical protein